MNIVPGWVSFPIKVPAGAIVLSKGSGTWGWDYSSEGFPTYRIEAQFLLGMYNKTVSRETNNMLSLEEDIQQQLVLHQDKIYVRISAELVELIILWTSINKSERTQRS